MSVFGLCSKFVKNAGGEPRFLFDVLYAFLQDNPLRIALDQHGRILELYAEAAKESDDLSRWLIHLGRNHHICFEAIDIEGDNLHGDELFVEVARKILPDPSLIAWSHQHYGDISDEGVEVLDRMEAARRIKRIIGGPRRQRKQKTPSAAIINKGVLKMTGDRYSANQAGAMGPNAQASNNTFTQATAGGGDINFAVLAPELARVRAAMRSEAKTAAHDIAIAEIAKAEEAANNGNAKGVVEHLKSAGKWALETATKIGTEVAAKTIEKYTGLG